MGHAYTYAMMDAIARFRRMMGWNVLFPIGLDKNGLPIEVQVEKAFKISIHNTPREEFIKKCKEVIAKSGDISLESFRLLGVSFNEWERKYEIGGRYDTDDPEYRRLTQQTFIDLWNMGLIYEDMKPTNYCPVCRTTISDAEVEYNEEKAQLNYIKFKVKGTSEYAVIATTRPELLCTCKAVLYHPDDGRHRKLKGKVLIVPVFGQEVDVIEHPYAKIDFGSGLVMICSFGDYGDVRLLRELDIEPTYAIDEKGRMNANAGKYKELTVKQAREAIIADLKSAGLIEKQEETENRVPICWRSKNPVEFVPMRELYLKQLDYKDDLLGIAQDLRFFAPESRQILIDWINSLNIDYVISRRRYYGTEIPLWYCKCGYVYVPEPGKYYQPWLNQPPIKKCPKCGGEEFTGEQRVFDTWFDSSNSELYILGYLWDRDFFHSNFPCSLRPQGKEIVRTWLYFSLLKAWLLEKKRAFNDVWINHHVVDESGTKMSKSLGNMIDPQEVMKKYGAEMLRIWTCLEGDIAQGDIRCSFQRIEGTSKFITKLWNIARFTSAFPQYDKEVGLERTDEWILAELAKLVKFVEEKCMAYEFNSAATAIRDFAWNIFAANYVEMVKPRAYAGSKAAWQTLHRCMRTTLLLLAPMVPFVTEKIWQELYAKDGGSIHAENFPKAEWDEAGTKYTHGIMEFNSMVWNMKKEKGLSLRDKVDIGIPDELKPFEKDLKDMHNIRK
jgi:valyl-tRNA synthetase